jgi:hypothetical protein
MAAFSTYVVSFLASVALSDHNDVTTAAQSGYTVSWPTFCPIAANNIAMWPYARIVANGAQLSIMVPYSLVVASVLIGIASGLRA